jgi:trimethylamine---corrinoid protein Co-methyltransferase
MTCKWPRAWGLACGRHRIARLMLEVSAKQFRQCAYTYTVINTNSPPRLDIPMADGIINFPTAGRVFIITPLTLAGAMAPVTITGALTHAEALAGITLAQIDRPGTPVMYGSFTFNADTRSRAPIFGTPKCV